jgi:hypothetical protein
MARLGADKTLLAANTKRQRSSRQGDNRVLQPGTTWDLAHRRRRTGIADKADKTAPQLQGKTKYVAMARMLNPPKIVGCLPHEEYVEEKSIAKGSSRIAQSQFVW